MTDKLVTPIPGRVARGAGGAGPLRRAYRSSPLRRLWRVDWTHRGLRPNDVFLASYPRSGNAWLAFIVLELAGRHATFDSVRFEVPIAGAHRNAPALGPSDGRFIKTHERYQPVYRRAIHLVRDPRDVALSYFRFMQRDGQLTIQPLDDVEATFDRFLDAFISGRLLPQGTWQQHLQSWLDAANNRRAQVLRLRYEDMRADPAGHVARIATWLGIEVTPARAADIAERCSLERMRQSEQESDPSVFGRVRPEVAYIGPASIGDWRTDLTAEQQRLFRAFSSGISDVGYAAPI